MSFWAAMRRLGMIQRSWPLLLQRRQQAPSPSRGREAPTFASRPLLVVCLNLRRSGRPRMCRTAARPVRTSRGAMFHAVVLLRGRRSRLQGGDATTDVTGGTIRHLQGPRRCRGRWTDSPCRRRSVPTSQRCPLRERPTEFRLHDNVGY